MVTVWTGSAEETVDFGIRLGKLLGPGDLVALTGDLGAGKTQFAKGVALGLDVPASVPVTSPTFTILNIYRGRIPFYHFDLYRLGGDADIVELGLADYFHGSGVCLVEWAERLDRELPAERLEISFSHETDDVRRLDLTCRGKRYEMILEEASGLRQKNVLTEN